MGIHSDQQFHMQSLGVDPRPLVMHELLLRDDDDAAVPSLP
jgi:hypothetical protein